MKPLLLIALLAGQIYEWVDSSGESHFTNDPGSIPAGVKRRTTEGVEPAVSVTRELRDAGVPDGGAGKGADAGVKRPVPPPLPPAPRPPPGPDSCERANAKLQQLEQKLAQAKAGPEGNLEARTQRCNLLLQTHGQPAFAACMASRENPREIARAAANVERVQQELDATKEELRRAQVDGCR